MGRNAATMTMMSRKNTPLLIDNSAAQYANPDHNHQRPGSPDSARMRAQMANIMNSP